PTLPASATPRLCSPPATSVPTGHAPTPVSASAAPSACAPAAVPAPVAQSPSASGSDAAARPGLLPATPLSPIAGTAATIRIRFLVRSRSSGRAPSWFAHPAHTQRQTAASLPSHCSLSMACARLYQRLPLLCSVRNPPGLFCQGCPRSVPPPPPPP